MTPPVNLPDKPLSGGDLNKVAREQIGEQSAQTSTSVRALALAVIAVSWLFIAGKNAEPAAAIQIAKSELLLGFSLLAGVLALALDAAQYAVTTFMWSRYYRVIEAMTDARRVASSKEGLWRRADRYGLIEYILDQTDSNTPALRASKNDSIIEVKRILTRYHDGTANATVQQQLWNAFNRPEVPLPALRVNSSLFWGKSASVLAGSALIVAFIVVKIWWP